MVSFSGSGAFTRLNIALDSTLSGLDRCSRSCSRGASSGLKRASTTPTKAMLTIACAILGVVFLFALLLGSDNSYTTSSTYPLLEWKSCVVVENVWWSPSDPKVFKFSWFLLVETLTCLAALWPHARRVSSVETLGCLGLAMRPHELFATNSFVVCSTPSLKFVKEFPRFPCLDQGIGKATIPKIMRNGPKSPQLRLIGDWSATNGRLMATNEPKSATNSDYLAQICDNFKAGPQNTQVLALTLLHQDPPSPPQFTVSGSTPTPWSGPFRDHGLRPWSQSPLSTENPRNKGFSGFGAPIPRPRGRGRHLFAEQWMGTLGVKFPGLDLSRKLCRKPILWVLIWRGGEEGFPQKTRKNRRK